ncbi:MAG: EF-P lysine aminoacylase EpmA [Wenzhouxiangella sp.]
MSDWRPSARPAALRMRAATLKRIRDFMAERQTMEVATPVITSAGVTEPQIESLALDRAQGYLRTSPEYFHKRMLAAGCGDLYEIGPVFRSAESGRVHRQEFTLLEWYRVGRGWQHMATETLELIIACSPPQHPGWQTRTVAWHELFRERLGFDPSLDAAAAVRLTRDSLPADCDTDMRLDYLFSTAIQDRFPRYQLTVVHGYPASQAALACLDPLDPRLACRFEVFAGSLELANGYQELTDPVEQRRRFERDNARRAVLGRPGMPIDEDLLAAMAHGLPACSGVAMGIERLLMAFSEASEISAVMAFG